MDFTVTVPSPLERGKDYNYNYEIVDGVGILTMEVYKSDKQHRIQAGLNNPSGILYDVITRSPAGLTYHDSLCGNGGGGMPMPRGRSLCGTIPSPQAATVTVWQP